MVSRKHVYIAIDEERDYQNLKWAGHKHEVGAYLTILKVYIDKAAHEWCGESGDAKAKHQIRKIAAIAVACMEENGVMPRCVYDFEEFKKEAS